VISQILELFGFQSRTTTDKQEDLLKKIKTLRSTKTMPLVKQNSFDRRLKKPADDQERDLLNEHEVNKVLFPDDFLAKAIQ
jgi:hypothetical protein